MYAYELRLEGRYRKQRNQRDVCKAAHFVACGAALNAKFRLAIPLIDIRTPDRHPEGKNAYSATVTLVRQCEWRNPSKAESVLNQVRYRMEKRAGRTSWVVVGGPDPAPEYEASAQSAGTTRLRWNGTPVEGDWGPTPRSAVTPRQFVEVWMRSPGVREVGKQLGMTFERARDRAEFYRNRGVPLPRLRGEK